MCAQPARIVTQPTSALENLRIIAQGQPQQPNNSTREHIYEITDAYIGSDEKVSRFKLLNFETMTFEEISLPEGAEELFLEISSSARDNFKEISLPVETI